MATTTVHIPDQLLERIDQIVKEKAISRNRFIIQACEQSLKNAAGNWPKAFFDSKLDNEDAMLLHEGVLEMEQAILSNRKNRKASSL